MIGGIYTLERCSICETIMRDNGRNAVSCPKHPKQKARALILRFGREIKKRFSDYEEASRFLNGLRYKVDEGSFDVRDYQSGNPLGFSVLAGKYITHKEREVSQDRLAKGTLAHIRYDLNKASEHFGVTSVREIGYAEIEDFLDGMEGLSSKTIQNVKANLHAFWRWLFRRKEITEIPEFPEVKAELGWRKTVDKATQDFILEEIKKLAEKTPRVYLAFRWLCTYTAIRPGELRSILESDVDLKQGTVTIRDHKTKRSMKGPKIVPLLDQDIEIIKSLPRGFAQMPFFRHDASIKGMPQNTPFGNRVLRKFWNRACGNLGIEGVDLYGGTRHSTQQFYRQHLSTEDCMRLSMHTTSKAGQRYLEVSRQELIRGYALSREAQKGTPKVHRKTGKISATNRNHK